MLHYWKYHRNKQKYNHGKNGIDLGEIALYVSFEINGKKPIFSYQYSYGIINRETLSNMKADIVKSCN